MCEVQTNRIKSLLGPRTTNAFLRKETLPNIPFYFDWLPYIGQKCREKMLAISPFLLSFFLFAKLLLVETSEDCNIKWQWSEEVIFYLYFQLNGIGRKQEIGWRLVDWRFKSHILFSVSWVTNWPFPFRLTMSEGF